MLDARLKAEALKHVDGLRIGIIRAFCDEGPGSRKRAFYTRMSSRVCGSALQIDCAMEKGVVEEASVNSLGARIFVLAQEDVGCRLLFVCRGVGVGRGGLGVGVCLHARVFVRAWA